MVRCEPSQSVTETTETKTYPFVVLVHITRTGTNWKGIEEKKGGVQSNVLRVEEETQREMKGKIKRWRIREKKTKFNNGHPY